MRFFRKLEPASSAPGVDAVAHTGAGVPLGGYIVFSKTRDGFLQAGIGHDRVGIAVAQQHGRAAFEFGGDVLGIDQFAGIADHTCNRLCAAQGDVDGHHGALAETDQREVAVIELEAFKFGIEVGVDQLGSAVVTGFELLGPLVHETVPLAAHGVLIAGIRRVGAGETGMGQGRLQSRCQADQVVTVGAPAMQQHDKLAGFATAGRYDGS